MRKGVFDWFATNRNFDELYKEVEELKEQVRRLNEKLLKKEL